MNKYSIIVCVLFIFGSASLLLYKATPTSSAHMVLDSDEYVEVAQTFAKTGRIENQRYGMPVHPVGYYWLLGTMYSIFSENQLWIFIAQWLLTLLCFFMLFKSTLVLFDRSHALLSVILASCNIGFIVFSQILLAEILLTACLSCFLYVTFVFLKYRQICYLLYSALLLSLSVMIKPVALYFWFPMVLIVWYSLQNPLLMKVKYCFLFLCFFYTPIVSYMVYNYTMFSQFAVTTLHAGNLLDYFLPRRILPRLHESEREKVQMYLAQSSDQKDFQARSAFLFCDLLKKHPLLYCYSIIEGIIKIFFGLHTTQLKIMFNQTLRNGTESFFSMQGKTWIERMRAYICYGTDNKILWGIAFFETLWLLLSYFLIVCVLFLLFLRSERTIVFFVIAYVGYIVLAASFEGCGRYRMMLEPILIMLAAYALVESYYSMKKFFIRKDVYANI